MLAVRSSWLAPRIAPYEVHKKFFDLQEKWQFSGVSLYALHNALALTPDNVQHFETLFDPAERYAPVSVIYDQDGETYLDAQTLGDPRRLFLEIDFQYPRDVLLSLIEEQLRKVLEERKQLVPSNVPRKRRRLDKVDFYLKVYDLAEAGETFTRIALAVGKPLSSVKSAFLAARRNVFVEIPARAGIPPIAPPSKRETPRAEFVDARSLTTHMARCSKCQKAERYEEMCPQTRGYADQDYVSQHELLVDEPHPRRRS